MEPTPPSTLPSAADLLKERIANKTKEVQVLIQRGLHQFVPDVTQDLIALKQKYFEATGEWLHVPVDADVPETGPTGAAFWRKIKQSLTNDGIAVGSKDRAVLEELCTPKTWMDALPAGCVSSYQELYQSVRGLSSEDAQMIERDVLRTAGAVRDGASLFMDTTDSGKAGCARAMHRVLTAISVVDDTGYCQGMNYTVDFLLKCVSEESTFCLFLHFLRNHHLSCLYETQLPILSQFMDIYERQLLLRCPSLAAVLQSREFLAPFYSIEWFTTAWVLACPPALTLAIYDLLLFGFKDTFLRCAVAIMEVLEPQLVLMSSEDLLKNFREVVVGVDPDQVVRKAFQIQLQPVELDGWFLDPVAEEAEFLTMLRCRYLKEMERIDLHGRKGFAFRDSIDVRSSLEKPTVQFNTGGMTARESATSPTAEADAVENTVESLLSDGDTKLAEEGLQTQDSLSSSGPAPSALLVIEVDAPTELPTGNEFGHANVQSPICPLSPTQVQEDPAPAEVIAQAVTRHHLRSESTTELLQALAELKAAMDVADRMLGWSEVHRRWLRCSLQIPSDYMRYRVSDELLRGAIASRAHIRVIAFCLVIVGSDPNSQDFALWTPLHLAVHCQRPDIVRLLLLCGADPTMKGALVRERPRPKTPEELAISENSISANMPYNAAYITWPASLVILRGKVCLNCNQLFGEQIREELKMRCSYCRLIVCSPCSNHHRCAQQLLYEDEQKQRRGPTPHPTTGRPKSLRLLPDVNSMRALVPGAGTEDGEDARLSEMRSISLEGPQTHKPKTPSRGRAFSCDQGMEVVATVPKLTVDGALHPRLEHKDDMALSRKPKPKSPSPPTEAAIIERRPSSIRSSVSDHQTQGQELALPVSPISPRSPRSPTPPTPGAGTAEYGTTGPAKSTWRAFNWSWPAAATAEPKKQTSSESITSPKGAKSPPVQRNDKGKGSSKLSLGSMFASISTSAKVQKNARSQEPQTATIPAYWMGYKESPKGPRSWQRALMHLLLNDDSSMQPTADSLTTEQCLAAMNAPCPRQLWLRDEMMLVIYAAFRDPRGRESESPRHHRPRGLNKSANIEIIEHYYNEPRPHRPPSVGGQQELNLKQVDSDEETFTEARQRPWLSATFKDWLVNENSALWIRDETVWYCRHCGIVFTLFSRKHHCRRCGLIYCDDHAPVLHVGKLLPPELWPHGKNPGERDPNVRLCGSCVKELVKPTRVLEEIQLSYSKYNLKFWNTVLHTLQRPLSAALDDQDDQELSDDLHQMTFTRLAPVRRWMKGTIRRIMGSGEASESKFS